MTAAVSVRLADPAEFDECFTLRRSVFMVEQGVSEGEEFDGHDHDADKAHLIAWWDDATVGTARLWFKPGEIKIQRVCVTKAARGHGVGVALIEKALEIGAGTAGITRATLAAQTYAIPFYERFGFVAEGAEFNDAGIPHRDMARALG